MRTATGANLSDKLFITDYLYYIRPVILISEVQLGARSSLSYILSNRKCSSAIGWRTPEFAGAPRFHAMTGYVVSCLAVWLFDFKKDGKGGRLPRASISSHLRRHIFLCKPVGKIRPLQPLSHHPSKKVIPYFECVVTSFHQTAVC
jgi:hypothetical protein